LGIGVGLALDFWSTDRPLHRLLDEYAELVELATGLGFDSVWAGEGRQPNFQPGHVPSPLLVLAAMAGRTELRIGTGVTLLPIWDPLRLAYDGAVLDHIIGGRFILGVGLGHPPTMRRFGVEPQDAPVRMDESLAALRRLWAGEESFHGSQIHIDGGINPGPFRAGGPPIWVGGGVLRSIERAVEYGDAWYGSTPHSFSLIARQAERYRRLLAERGREPAEATVAINRTTFLAPTDHQALEDGAPFVSSIVDFYARLGMLDSPATSARAQGSVGDEVVFVGSPRSCVASVRKYINVGVTHIIFRVSMGNMPPALARRTVTLLGTEVVPHFRD
jgi:alkanesulfonate monooxygenase SsuD/methylene tetrahydromethanopterin reductase-like flavin-dependent oxidoreductase (luciferase family)